MTETIHNYFATEELAPSSKRMFNTCIDKWRACWDTPKTLAWIVAHPTEALKALRENPDIKNTPANNHRFISAIVAYIKHELRDESGVYTRWKDSQVKNSEPMREHRLTGKPTELQAGKELNWSDICKARDELPLTQTKLLLAFYTYINPMRADYFATELVHDAREPEGNYIRCLPRDKYVLVIQDYKTKKAFGKMEVALPEPLVKMLTEYLREHAGRKYLFLKETDEPFSRNGFSCWTIKHLSRAMGKQTTLTALRHAFTSQLDFNRPIAELNTIAKSMGHSVATQRTYKWDE